MTSDANFSNDYEHQNKKPNIEDDSDHTLKMIIVMTIMIFIHIMNNDIDNYCANYDRLEDDSMKILTDIMAGTTTELIFMIMFISPNVQTSLVL